MCLIMVQGHIVKVVDGFMKDYPSLDRLYPAEVAIKSNCRCACLVEVRFV